MANTTLRAAAAVFLQTVEACHNAQPQRKAGAEHRDCMQLVWLSCQCGPDRACLRACIRNSNTRSVVGPRSPSSSKASMTAPSTISQHSTGKASSHQTELRHVILESASSQCTGVLLCEDFACLLQSSSQVYSLGAQCILAKHSCRALNFSHAAILKVVSAFLPQGGLSCSG